MVRCEDVACFYTPGEPVTGGLSFDVKKGERVGLIGANGAGKTTLFKAMVGLAEFSGRIEIDGVPVEKGSMAEIRRRAGLVMQDSDRQMFMPTVFEDMIFGPMNYKMSREEAEKRADEILERLNISRLKHKHNHKLSGGELKMAALATILAMEPVLILADEPTAGLDPGNRRRVIDVMRGLDETLIVASHDLDMVLDTCDRVILLSGGRIAADGPVKDILCDKGLLEDNGLELPLSMAGRE